MLNRDYEGQNCSIARALEVVGERWTLLIIRDVLLGLHRFDEFQESLGIARNVLTDRLNRLVDEGVLERVLYNERPERYPVSRPDGPMPNNQGSVIELLLRLRDRAPILLAQRPCQL